MPQDLAGLPGCAFRAGFDELGIPVGVQLTGAQWRGREGAGRGPCVLRRDARDSGAPAGVLDPKRGSVHD